MEYYGIICMERILGMPGSSPEPPGSRGSPGHAPVTPGDAPGTPGHAPGTPGDAPGTPGHAPTYQQEPLGQRETLNATHKKD